MVYFLLVIQSTRQVIEQLTNCFMRHDRLFKSFHYLPEIRQASQSFLIIWWHVLIAVFKLYPLSSKVLCVIQKTSIYELCQSLDGHSFSLLSSLKFLFARAYSIISSYPLRFTRLLSSIWLSCGSSFVSDLAKCLTESIFNCLAAIQNGSKV